MNRAHDRHHQRLDLVGGAANYTICKELHIVFIVCFFEESVMGIALA